jgi:hypothetical protein
MVPHPATSHAKDRGASGGSTYKETDGVTVERARRARRMKGCLSMVIRVVQAQRWVVS